MKKEYINPEMEVVEIKMTMGILAGSPGGTGNGDTPGDDYDPGDDSYAPGLLFSIME